MRARGVPQPRRAWAPARPGESSRQLVAHSRGPRGYVRNGVADVLVCFAPLLCERHARAAPTRTRADLAETLRWLSGDACSRAGRMVLAWDNPSAHPVGSPCEAFPPEEAERLARRLGPHHAQGHGSWLDMAEIEIGCLMCHGLPARVADIDEAGRPARA